MGDFYVDGISPVPPRSVVERQAARLTVARFALDAQDLRGLLDCLGLWRADDAVMSALTPTPSWDGGRR